MVRPLANPPSGQWDTATQTSSRGSIDRLQILLSLAILFIASILISHCRAMVANHAVQVPLVNWLDDRSLYPSDPFMTVLARYPSGLWPAVALGARVFPLEGMLLILLVLERVFVLYAAGRLARAFVPRSGLAIVGTLALFAFAIQPLLGDGTIVEDYFEQTGLAVPFLLLAFAAFHERRRLAWAIWLGIGFNLTPMYGFFAATFLGAAFIVEPELRGEWKRWIRPFLLYLALASYGVYYGIAAAVSSWSDDDLWFAAARSRGQAHLFPLQWGSASFLQFGALVVFFVILLVRERRAHPRLFRQGLAWTVMACLWLLEAFIAAYVVHSRPLMMMQPARATDLWICLAGTGIVGIAAAGVEHTDDPRSRRVWVLILGASLVLWFPPGTWVVAALLLITALPPVWRNVAPWISPKRLAWAPVVWVAVVGALAARDGWEGDGRIRDMLSRGPNPDIRKLAAWAQANTARDAVFLIKPGSLENYGQFMGLAKRSIFVDWEEGTALYWAPDYLPEWENRLRALGFDIRRTDRPVHGYELNEAYTNLRDEDVARIKKRYRLSYWIVSEDHPSRYPEVFHTWIHRVLDVR